MSLQCSFLTGFIRPPNKQTNKQTKQTLNKKTFTTQTKQIHEGTPGGVEPMDTGVQLIIVVQN
jgi:hypothetical protein